MRIYYLTKLYSEYAEGLIERGEFEGMVYQFLSKNKEKTSISHWKEDDYEDFLSWFYQRLHTSIDSYQETGASFDAYINSILRASAREFRVRKITNSVTEYSAWSVQVPDMYVYEEAQVYSHDITENILSKIAIAHKGRKNPKQILTLILKCYYYVSDDFINRVAKYTEIDAKQLREMVDKLRKMRKQRDDNIYRMKERIYCQYYRCIVYEKRLGYIQEGTVAYLKLKRRLIKARQRLERMRERIQKIRTDATNKEVAEVIGVSKGAVDSSLHKLKNRWDMLADKAMLN